MSDNEKSTKGNFWGLMPLIVFLAVYLLTGVCSGSFDNMPLMIGIGIACIIAFLLVEPGKKKEERMKFDDKVTLFCKGGGDDTLILMVIIFLLAGAFYGVAKNMHAVDSIVNIGLTILPANLILPGLFLIGCILSFSMGTSMGTVAALMPIGIDIAAKTGCNVALIGGVVVGGAMFGDNLSFISDTTIAATRTQEVANNVKFKANALMVLPAVIINLVLLALQPIKALNATGAGYSFNIVNIIPYVLIIVLSLIGMNVIPVMMIGIVSGQIIGVFHNDFTLLKSLTVLHDGMTSMEDMALIAILVGGMVALMKYFGGIDYLLAKLTKSTKSSRGAELSIAALVSLLDIATTNNTISIIAAGPIARNIADKFNVSRARVASILDLFSSAFNGLLPYAGQLLVAGGLAKVSPMSMVPYVWYDMLMLVFGVIFILIGWPKGYGSGKNKKDEKAAV